MRPGWLWLLAVAGPVVGGVVASATESDAWVGVTVLVWTAGPVAAFLGMWTGLRRAHWLPRLLVSGVVGAVWTIAAILLWVVGVAAGEEVDI